MGFVRFAGCRLCSGSSTTSLITTFALPARIGPANIIIRIISGRGRFHGMRPLCRRYFTRNKVNSTLLWFLPTRFRPLTLLIYIGMPMPQIMYHYPHLSRLLHLPSPAIHRTRSWVDTRRVSLNRHGNPSPQPAIYPRSLLL